MRPKASPNYLAGYPDDITAQVQKLIADDRLAGILLKKYPAAHAVRTDRALYDYVHELKERYLRNAGQLSKICFALWIEMAVGLV